MLAIDRFRSWTQQDLIGWRRFAPAYLSYVIVLLGVGLRLLAMHQHSLTSDDLAIAYYASHEDWRAVLWSNYPPLHGMMLRGWIALWGASEAVLRSLSVVGSIGALLVAWRYLLPRLPGHRQILGATLLAISPLSLFAAGEVRSDAWFEFVLAINLALFLRLYDSPTTANKQSFWIYAASLLPLWSLHFIASLVHLAQMVVLMMSPEHRRSLKRELMFLVGVLAVITLAAGLWIGWPALSWMKMNSFSEFFRYPYDVLWVTLGYSHLAVAVVCGLILIKAIELRQIWQSPIGRFLLLYCASTIIVGLFLGHRFAEQRFLVATALPLALVAGGVEIQWPRRSWRWAGALLAAFFLVLWSKKSAENLTACSSGWKEARAMVVQDLDQTLVFGHAGLSLIFPSRSVQWVDPTQRETALSALAPKWVIESAWGRPSSISSGPHLVLGEKCREPVRVYRLEL